MGFIKNLKAIGPDNPVTNNRQITMKDIVRCKGSGSFGSRFIGQIQTVFKRGKFVTDDTVSDFLMDRHENLEKISEEFKKVATPTAPQNKVEAKQIKKDQAIAIRLSHVFAKASDGVFRDLESEMKTTNAVLRGLRSLDRIKPLDLLRAAVFEKNGNVESSDDLKHHFSEFVKNRDIQDTKELRTAFYEFKNEIADAIYGGEEKALEKLKAYASDKSTRSYAIADALNLDKEEVNRVRAMSVPELLEILKEEAPVADLNAEEMHTLVVDARLAMNSLFVDPVTFLRAAVYEKMNNFQPANDIKTDFSEFMKVYQEENVVEEDFAVKVAYLIFQNQLIESANNGDADAIRKLQKYSKGQPDLIYKGEAATMSVPELIAKLIE